MVRVVDAVDPALQRVAVERLVLERVAEHAERAHHDVGRASRIPQNQATSGTKQLINAARYLPLSRQLRISRPLMIVASPIGMQPKNIDTTEWPKTRRAPSKKNTHRAA